MQHLPLPSINFGLDPYYQNLREHYGDFNIYFALNFGANLYHHFVAIMFVIIDHFNLFEKYRIQPKSKPPPWNLVREAFLKDLVTTVVYWFVARYVYDWEIQYVPHKVDGPLPDIFTLAWHVFLCIFIMDTWFYWTHRLLHLAPLYQHHKGHHKFLVTAAYASTYGDFVEGVLIQALPPLFLFILLRIHIVTQFVALLVMMSDSMNAHCGYNFPWVPFDSAVRHEFHHSHNTGSFAVTLPFWDWVCGTDRNLKRFIASKKAKAKTSASE